MTVPTILHRMEPDSWPAFNLGGGTAAPDSTRKYDGTRSAMLNAPTGEARYARVREHNDFGYNEGEVVWMEAAFWLPQSVFDGTYVNILRFDNPAQSGGDGAQFGIAHDTGSRNFYVYAGSYTSAGARLGEFTLPIGRFFHLGVMLRVSGGLSGAAHVEVDGTWVVNRTGVKTALGQAKYTRAGGGIVATGGATPVTLNIDRFSIRPTRMGPVAPPAPPPPPPPAPTAYTWPVEQGGKLSFDPATGKVSRV